MTEEEVLAVARKILNMVFVRFGISAGIMLVAAAVIGIAVLVVNERSNKK